MDDLDRRLLALLREDARRSFRTLAAMAKTTPPTAAARIRRLEEMGVIEGYTVRVAGESFAPLPHGGTRVRCHTCDAWTERPVEATIGGRRHPFCCTTCLDTFAARHRRHQGATP